MAERSGRGPDTWMPLYIGDYLADTLHLSAEQHGAYLMLLMAAWRKGGALQDDDSQLAAVAKVSPQQWKKHKPVLAAFFHVEGGIWRQKRLNAELAIAVESQQKKQAAGKAGASARYGKGSADATADASANAGSNRMATADDPHRHPNTPSPSPVNLTPPTPLADAMGEPAPNGHDAMEIVGKAKREKRPVKRPMPEGWQPSETTLAWVNRFLAEHGLNEDWAQRQHELFATKARARGWVYADWDRAYEGFFRENGPGGRYAA